MHGQQPHAGAACDVIAYQLHGVPCSNRFGEAFASAPYGYAPQERFFSLWYKGGPSVDAEIKQVCTAGLLVHRWLR
jgi:hypothetical protein